MREMRIDRQRFGPWALITGASSGIGKEFARQLAASRINLVLVARPRALLEETGTELSATSGVQHRVVAVDLSQGGFITELAAATDDLDVGLVVSHAGTVRPGAFLSDDRDDMAARLRLSTVTHVDIVWHFAPKLVARKRGGLVFVGALGAERGVPLLASDAAARAYVHSFGEALHAEFGPLGIHVTVVQPGPVDTPVLAKLGLSADVLPMKPLTVEQCVSESLAALETNRAAVIPGRVNRIMNTFVPPAVSRAMMRRMFARARANAAEPIAQRGPR
jgi:short-subunit dehydrogenase